MTRTEHTFASHMDHADVERTLCIMAATLAAGDAGEYSDCGPIRCCADLDDGVVAEYARTAVRLRNAVQRELIR